MSELFTQYCCLCFRAAGHDLAALNELYNLHEQHGDALGRQGATGVMSDLAAVTVCRLMRQSDEHIRVTPEQLKLAHNQVCRSLFPRLKALCQQ